MAKMKITPNISSHTYEYIHGVILSVLEDEKVGQLDGKGNINFHHFFGLLDLVNSRMSKDGERIRGEECDIFREVFWDLFKDGFISLGNLESQSMGYDYEIRKIDLDLLSFPYFRLTNKFYSFMENKHNKNKKLQFVKSIPKATWRYMKMLVMLIINNIGILISILKGLK